MIKRKRLRIATLALISVMIFAGCGATKETTEKTAEKTYNYSKEYQTAAEHLEECILEDKTYTSLKDALTSYENKDLKKLSKKDAKALKSTMEDIEDYYEASADTIQDALVQIGQVYPTEDGFYDETFKASTTALFEELNALLNKGHYKEAADKLNEITTAYTAYVESKGQTVSADISVDAGKTASVKDANASAKTGSKSPAKSTNGSASATAGNSTPSVGNNMAATGNTSASVSSNGNATTGGTTTSNTASGGNNTNTTPSTGKNNGSSGSHGNTTNNTYTPTRKTWTYTCPECGWTITGYDGDENANEQVNQHDRMHSTEEANAQLYRSQAQAAYGQAQANALDAGQPWNTNMHDWCLANGWDVDRMNADAIKYGWGTL